MSMSIEKILESIPNVRESKCTLKRYNASHSSLTLEVSGEGENNLYLVFEGVEHVQCPISWQGVGLYLGADEECVSILNGLNKGFEKIPRDYLSKKYSLYKFQNPNFEIHILASSIYLTNHIPAN